MPYLLGYALLFTVVGVVFIFAHLMLGKFVRPKRPDAEKLTVYECGEPTIGSAWVQFDLRFYVVALLFVIFDVEMAFFFPWAVVFGKTNQLAREDLPPQQRAETARLLDPQFDRRVAEIDSGISRRNEAFDKEIKDRQKELDEVNLRLSKVEEGSPERDALLKRKTGLDEKIARLQGSVNRDSEILKRTQASSAHYAWVAFLDILVFFGVLLVGFAYLWRRGDLNWVRSTAAQHEGGRGQGSGVSENEQPILAKLVSVATTSPH